MAAARAEGGRGERRGREGAAALPLASLARPPFFCRARAQNFVLDPDRQTDRPIPNPFHFWRGERTNERERPTEKRTSESARERRIGKRGCKRGALASSGWVRQARQGGLAASLRRRPSRARAPLLFFRRRARPHTCTHTGTRRVRRRLLVFRRRATLGRGGGSGGGGGSGRALMCGVVCF